MSVRRAGRALLLAFGVLLEQRAAWGQQVLEDFLTAKAFEPDKNSQAYQNVVQSAFGNGQLYMALGALQRDILRGFGAETSMAITFDIQQSYGAAMVPGRCVDDGIGCSAGDRVRYPVDLLTSTTAIGFKARWVGAFYSGSASTPTTFNDTASRTYRSLLAMPISGAIQSAGAFALGREGEADIGKAQRDWLAGGNFDFSAAQVQVGYVRSASLLVGLSRPQQGVTASAVFDDKYKTLNYFRAGLDRFPWSTLGLAPAGYSTLLGRKLQFQAPVSPAAGNVSAQKENARVDYWTLHAEQIDIVSLVDVGGAVALTPVSGLHLLNAAVHTPGFYESRTNFGATEGKRGGKAKGGKGDGGLKVAGGRLQGGVVQLPEMRYLGAEGKPRFSVMADALFNAGDGNVVMSLRRNDPDVVVAYPFAQDSWTLMVSVVLSGMR